MTVGAKTVPPVRNALSDSAPLYPASLLCAAVTIAAAPLYTVRWHYGPLPTTLLETFILLTLVVFMVETIRAGAGFAWPSPFTLPVLIFLVAGAISVVAAPDRRAALGLYRAYLIEPIAFFYVIGAVAQTARRAYVLIAGLWVAGLIVAIPNAIVVLLAIAHHTLNLAGTPPVVIYLTQNAVALFLLPPIALAGCILLHGRAGWERRAAAVFLPIAGAAFLLTFSRGGYLALLAVAIGLALSHRRRLMLLAAGAIVVIAFGLIPPIRHRLGHELNPSDPNNTLVGRSYLWRATLSMLRHHPLFGSGLSGFAKDIYPYWGGLGRTDSFIDPHNILLNFWTETGILGVIGFAWLLYTGFLASWRGWRASVAEWAPIHLGVLLALVGVVVHGLVDVPYFKNDLSLEFWFLLGLTWAGARWSDRVATLGAAASR
ncbi:MAG TPA: O-antigen ligase family protein [Candidatus Sulfotelmatobacter sp.]|nr:O-antigen ligase family protein [Candidatus Sulfotelmatobacter sp.]